MLRDLVSNLGVELGLKAQVLTADANCASVNLQDDMAMMVLANVGLSGDTLSGSVKIELELEHSDDNSAFTDVPNEELSSFVAGTNVGTFAVIDAAAEDEQLYKVGYKGHKQYVRCVVNLTGTHTNGTPIGVSYLLKPMKLPA